MEHIKFMDGFHTIFSLWQLDRGQSVMGFGY